MIKKGVLLKQLDSLIETEKMLSPLLDRHISSALFLSNLDETRRKEIKERFQKMAVRQAMHIESLARIKQEVEKGKSDVY